MALQKGAFNTNVHLPRVSVATEDSHAKIQKVLSEGSIFDNVFYFILIFFSFFHYEGRRVQISLVAGQNRPTSETSFKWRFAGGPMMAQH